MAVSRLHRPLAKPDNPGRFKLAKHSLEVYSASKSVFILRAAETITLQSCDVENASENTIAVAAKEKGSISATYCAASNSNMTNCRNKTGMPGTNMHCFKGQNSTAEVDSLCLNSQERFPPCENEQKSRKESL